MSIFSYHSGGVSLKMTLCDSWVCVLISCWVVCRIFWIFSVDSVSPANNVHWTLLIPIIILWFLFVFWFLCWGVTGQLQAEAAMLWVLVLFLPVGYLVVSHTVGCWLQAFGRCPLFIRHPFVIHSQVTLPLIMSPVEFYEVILPHQLR